LAPLEALLPLDLDLDFFEAALGLLELLLEPELLEPDLLLEPELLLVLDLPERDFDPLPFDRLFELLPFDRLFDPLPLDPVPLLLLGFVVAIVSSFPVDQIP